MHIAETEEQARSEVRVGLVEWAKYAGIIGTFWRAMRAGEEPDPDVLVDSMNESGYAVVGTPDMAIRQIERLRAQAGEFGAYLIMDTNWAGREAKFASFERFAREVAPAFSGERCARIRSLEWLERERNSFQTQTTSARAKAEQAHHAERTPAEAATH
jgi:limonene 1,2-monooxygenase